MKTILKTAMAATLAISAATATAPVAFAKSHHHEAAEACEGTPNAMPLIVLGAVLGAATGGAASVIAYGSAYVVGGAAVGAGAGAVLGAVHDHHHHDCAW